MATEIQFAYSFEAFDDNQNLYTLAVYISKVKASDLENLNTPPRGGLSFIQDQKGLGVMPIVKGHYRLATGVIVRSDDPKAP
jgi:hypothetical protein